MPRYTSKRIREIRSLLADLDSGGMSVAEFARTRGLAQCTVYQWRNRFSNEAIPTPAAVDSRPIRADLVEIRRPLIRDQRLEITIGPATIRVPPGFDADDLQRAVEAVQGC